MRYLYLLTGIVITVMGAYYVLGTYTPLGDWVDDTGAIVGLVLLFLGALNLLNYCYGATARGTRWAAIGANAAMQTVMWLTGPEPSPAEALLIGTLVLAALLSLSPRASRPRPTDG
jgi:hypothetical protein